ncbi:hypothetical protein HanXRQr2_Chr13g0580971 [Helianthus annuus]|uniref:Uncharacterized protein n=1 Tax=Helianthus annuus TaxID=4232 RepID=A0A9K3EGI4_HELAN|nr:hypothetical protein HanXRQr2_Chr13g0580971 [Helianthus annuus]
MMLRSRKTWFPMSSEQRHCCILLSRRVKTKIELTKAVEKAFARGLLIIKNDDLEEVRELGSATYGAFYYMKWKGSDVTIKRIQGSCFAGKPSERERFV